MRPPKLLFVDLETSGATPLNDRITEIGIVTVEDGRVERWSTLVNPGVPIPPFIQNLTGISDEMVADAPPFAALLPELQERLSGGLFVAHNVRFDYGFLKSAFKDHGIAWRSDLLCTVKLSRALFPQEPRHSLDALVARHGLVAEARHRALADADLLWQFWQMLERDVEAETLTAALAKQMQRLRLPPGVDADLVEEMPNRCGVYMFYGENDALIYAAKTVHMRARVLAHFAAGDSDAKEQRLAAQVRRIDWRETAGEVGALLLEARLVRQHKPLHNRRPKKMPAGEAPAAWPFNGPVALREQGKDGRSEIHVVDNWNWLGSARSDEDVAALLATAPAAPAYDYDSYRILQRYITRGLMEITPLR